MGLLRHRTICPAYSGGFLAMTFYSLSLLALVPATYEFLSTTTTSATKPPADKEPLVGKKESVAEVAGSNLESCE